MLILILLLVLILVNAYFSAAEIAFVYVKKFRIQQEADKGDKNAKQILEFLKNPDEYLSSIQVGITLVGIIEGLYGGEALEAYIEPRLILWGLSHWSSHLLSLILGIGLITYFTILIGELVPKYLAIQFPQKMALRLVPSFKLFTLLIYPFVQLLTRSTRFIIQMLGIRGSENQKLTDSDLKSLLNLASNQGTLEKNELLLHENIFSFYEGTIEKIMTTFEKIVSIDESMTSAAIEDIIRKSTHNYFPVIRQKNKIVGYLSAKDFFMYREKKLMEILLPAHTTMGSKNLPELLDQFKAFAYNFGMVTNEKNELIGVVTMHDIGEILIGKIP